jgi:Dna[CI] antecedent, DciA
MPDQPHQFSKLAEELVGDLRGVEFDEPRRSHKRPTKDLAKVVEELMVQHQIGRPSAEQSIRDRWAELVGAANASYSHAARIERGRLIVLAAHSVVRNEIFLHREEIVQRIRKLPGCETLRSLNIRAG